MSQEQKTITIPIAGMDCAGCTRHVQKALLGVTGVSGADVYLASERAVVYGEGEIDLEAVRTAVADAGYQVPESAAAQQEQALTRQAGRLITFLFTVILLIIIVGEWLGLFEQLSALIPWPIGLVLVIVSGWPIFRNVIRATLRREVIAHTLMSLGVVAALAVGEWVTALVVVFFMRVGEYVESFTAERARQALKDLTALAPQTARALRPEGEEVVPISEVKVGDTVLVRPGEQIPVDGRVLAGQATIDQSTITGESMPVEAKPGQEVYAATIAQLGSLRLEATGVGPDTTFGRVIQMVQEAEAHRADVQRFADRFTVYYLPLVAGIAALTFLLVGDALATAAVLVVACSCSIALATPVAMLASIGAAAQRGLLIKGGKYIEQLAQVDLLLIDKTGTLTLGRPQITDIIPLNGLEPDALLSLAASVERYSEHPLAEAVRTAAGQRQLSLAESDQFEAVPGQGVRGLVAGAPVVVGNRRMTAVPTHPQARALEAQGKTVLYIKHQGELCGLLAAADTLREEVPAALAQLRQLGIKQMELLTGDNEQVAQQLAEQLGIDFQAELLPEDKINVVKQYQAEGYTVLMVGDGVNDAPALAQADIGLAMGVSGTDIAFEAAHVVLLQESWSSLPALLHLARRTMGVVRMNLGLTAVYNIVGLTLAAFGILPPIWAAAAQSIPDLGIMANSSRLLSE